ncbi:MAG: hypothetical protein WBD78_10025 [Methylocella sp.]
MPDFGKIVQNQGDLSTIAWVQRHLASLQSCLTSAAPPNRGLGIAKIRRKRQFESQYSRRRYLPHQCGRDSHSRPVGTADQFRGGDDGIKTIYKMIPLAVVVAFAFGSSVERAWTLTQDQGDKIAKECQAAANFVNANVKWPPDLGPLVKV